MSSSLPISYRLPLADLPGGVSVGAAWYPLSRGKDVGKLCVRGDVQIRVKLVKHASNDSRVARARRIMSAKPTLAPKVSSASPRRALARNESNSSPERGQQRSLANQKPKNKKGPTQKIKVKPIGKKKRIISYKVDYSHVKSRTDCYNEMAYPVAEEVAYTRQKQQQQQQRQQQKQKQEHIYQPVISESSFPISTQIDLTMDNSGARSLPSSREGRRSSSENSRRRGGPPSTGDRSPPLDTSTLMKIYNHGGSTLSALPAGARPGFGAQGRGRCCE